MKMHQHKGVSLIITFFVMVIMLAVVLGIVIMLFSQVKIVANTGNSVSAFFTADTGVEKTKYLNNISPQTGQPPAAGFCGICSSCSSTSNDCQNCTLTPLNANGCDASCGNCKVTYSSSFDQRTFTIEATITPGSPNSIFFINSTGTYNNATRTSFFDSSK